MLCYIVMFRFSIHSTLTMDATRRARIEIPMKAEPLRRPTDVWKRIFVHTPDESLSYSSWSKIAWAVLAAAGRDRYGRCECCGEYPTSIDRRLGSIRAHDVHHKDGDRTNADPKNLAILCRGCHRLVEYLHTRQL